MKEDEDAKESAIQGRHVNGFRSLVGDLSQDNTHNTDIREWHLPDLTPVLPTPIVQLYQLRPERVRVWLSLLLDHSVPPRSAQQFS